LSIGSDAYIHIRINRNASISVVASLLVHALLLFFLSRQDLLNQDSPAAGQPQPIVVRLNPRLPARVEAAPAAEITQPVPVSPSHKFRKPGIEPSPLVRPDAPREVVTAPAAPVLIPQRPTPPPEQHAPSPPGQEPLDPGQFSDMASYLNAVRERRRLAGEDADRVNEEAVARERAVAEARTASKRSVQPSGTNGIFQILSMDARTAQFAFRGWKNEFSYSHREVYEVEAGPNEDVARAVVRKMIEIIRRYYNEDFNWESYRLGRVVVLSARLQDNAGLEDFLLQEFFGSRGIPAR